MSEQRNSDVVILGGGVIGCSIAYHLRKVGIEVLVVERQEVAAEASSAAAGLLSPFGSLTGPGPFSDLALASWLLAPELMPMLEEESGVQVEYRRLGTLHVAATSTEVEALRQQSAAWKELLQYPQSGSKKAAISDSPQSAEPAYQSKPNRSSDFAPGVKVEWLTGDEARKREPLLGADVKAAAFVEGGASIKAPAVTRAYAEAARRSGARFALSTEVTGIVQNGSRVSGVKTAQGETIACQQLVIAGGAWSARCGEWLGLTIPVSPMRGQILALRQPEPPLQHIVFGEDVYFVPKVDGTIFVGATVEQAGFDKSLTAGGVAWLLSSALHLAPALEHATIARMWAGLRPWSKDQRPILGKAPGWENVILATGHSGMGFELSAITGKTIAKLITTGKTPALIRAFGIERFLENA